jgi:hypothetical protein
MARPIDEFIMAWEALSGKSSGTNGWRSICVAPAGSCVLMTGRRFPGNEEALLVGFSMAKIPATEKLPEGQGFEVAKTDLHGDGKVWIALTRKESGSQELFAGIVSDVVGAMDAVHGGGKERLLRTLLTRVRSWQEFMRKGLQPLSPEAEIGLVGELTFLQALLESGIPASQAIEAWVGPLDGIQDFELGTGAIEIKTTLPSQGFPAKTGSIEQLDDSLRKPLFMAGTRFSQRESGITLSEIALSVREVLNSDHEAIRMFEDRLLIAGFHDSHADCYPRRFVPKGMRIVEVEDGFPRLVPGNVPAGIKRAIYEIDLDRAPGADAGVTVALKKPGAL